MSRVENHVVEPRTGRRAENQSLASEIGQLGFAGLVRQDLDSAACATPSSSVASSILAAASQAAAAVTAESPAAAAADVSAAVSSPSPATVAAQTVAPVAGSADAEQPPGTGLVTASGAPLIVLNAEPSWDARGYTSPAVYNPYYGTSLSPTREGYVKGFEKWFQTITVGPPYNYTWAPAYSATAEGAEEALRLVRQYVPDAKIVAYLFVGQDGDQISHSIELPDGTRLNAGLLLDSYYHQGCGVDSNSDAFLRTQVGLPGNAASSS
ncbi:MAG: hypothetical protein ABSH05_03300 [Bryobacteraceae bacterium]